METRWLYTSSPDLKDLCEKSKGVCVIPMGCIEKHGLHLPLGADIIQASTIAYRASQLETVAVFADFAFGDVPAGAPTAPPGTITVPIELQMQLLEVLCEQVARWGFNKILIYNGHGGNRSWLNVFLRNLSSKKRNYVVATSMMPLLSPHKMAEKLLAEGSGSIPELTAEDEALLIKYHNENMAIGHACMGETSNLMGICPEAVHLDMLGIESGKNTHVADYLKEANISLADDAWGINRPNAYSGDDPIGCNERIGKASVRLTAEALAHTVKVYKEDQNIIRWKLDEYQKGW